MADGLLNHLNKYKRYFERKMSVYGTVGEVCFDTNRP